MLDLREVSRYLLSGNPAQPLIYQLSNGSLDFDILDKIAGFSDNTPDSCLITPALPPQDKAVKDIYQHNKFIHQKINVKGSGRPLAPYYWRGKECSIFYDRVLVGFFSKEYDISYLGWGSTQYGSLLARLSKRNTGTILKGKVIVCLQRHHYEYGHFIHDVFSKLIYHHYNIEELSKVDYIIIDDPVLDRQKELILMLGFQGKFVAISNLKTLSLQGSITIYQIMGSYFLLGWVKNLLSSHYKASDNRNQIVYIDRGLNDRRGPVNRDDLLDMLSSMNVKILPTNNEMPYFEQLGIANNTENVVTLHGAQTINCLLTIKSILEIMPYPYSRSGWSTSTLAICNSIGLSRREHHAIQIAQENNHTFENLLLSDAQRELDLQESSYWQKQPCFISIKSLRDSIEEIVSRHKS